MYYPIAFEKDLLDRPRAVSLHQKDYVVWKTKKGVMALPNRCSHRGARLSDGRILSGSKLECPYHGWQFHANGTCLKIPQMNPSTKIPKACDLNRIYTQVHDGIVWLSNTNGLFQTKKTNYLDDSECLVSDYYLEAPYSSYLQLENLLDPAHLHFIHHGFQGNRSKASEIKLTRWFDNDYELYGYFEHTNPETPDIEISFIKPSMIEVSIYEKNKKTLLRKNIIYVSAIHEKACHVLFRDVAFKDSLIPSTSGFLEFHGKILMDRPWVQDHYEFINQTVIEQIMDQDIQVLVGQQTNCPDYLDAKYVMPTESDRLIVAFRKWVQSYKNMLVK